MSVLGNIIGLWPGKDHIKRKFRKKVPNGWGRQDYEGGANKAEFQDQIDLKNIQIKRGWIRAFVVNKIEGLRPSSKEKWHYPFANIKYKPIEE